MSFSVISRVFLKNNTIYKAPSKSNNKIKYNTPSNRRKGLNTYPFTSISLPNKENILLFTPLFNIPYYIL